jgi:hypothetical protein
MKYYAGLDVALEETAICVVDETGHIMKEAQRTGSARRCPFEPWPAAGAFRIGSLLLDGMVAWRVESHRLAGDLSLNLCFR